MDYRIEDLIDIPLFQVLQDRLNEIYSFPSAIIDNDGKVLTATAWQDVCVKFHRAHPECAAACLESDRYILSHLAEARPAVTYRCPHGLVDNATPIIIGGKHVANYFTGQFFLAPPDLDFFRAQARRYGFDEGEYLAAVAKVPIWSEQKLRQYLDFIKGFTEILCGIGLKHLQELEARRRLAESRSALEDMSVFNQQIIESVDEGIVVYGTDLRYRLWNPYMERLSGKSAAEVLGKHPLDVFPGEHGMVERTRLAVAGRAVPAVEFAQPGPDGTERWLSDACATLYSKEGAIVGAIATVRDVSEARRAHETEERLRAQLAQAQRLESIGRLAGGIAHDFNNMLSVVFAYLDLAVAELEPASQLRADLQEVRGVAARSADLTRQLLAFARRQPAAPRTLDLNDAVGSTLTMLRRVLGENVRLVWIPSAEAAVVSIDPSQLDQILTNLCVNARDAIPGTGTVTLETRLERVTGAEGGLPAGPAPGDYVVLTVADTGSGMTREVQEQVFEPFFSTKAGVGTGLGLATVHGIVSQNGGAIRVDSEPGGGTTFSIHLPLRAASPAEPRTAAVEPAPAAGAETVLLVEDDPAVRKVAQRVLERFGYVVIVADTPAEAQRRARAHGGPIHLLLTDVIMPEMDGVALAGEIRAVHPGIRVLFMSGYPTPLASERGTLTPDVSFLAKPFSPSELAEGVRAALKSA